jgi:hypothetical protein
MGEVVEVAEGLGIYVNADVDDDTSAVSGVSNLEEFNVNEDKENTNYPSTSPTDIISPLVPKKIALPKGMPKRSWVWNHFKPIMTNKDHAFCVLCSENIFYVDNNNNGNAQQEAYAAVADRIINSADAEISLYREEHSLPLQDGSGCRSRAAGASGAACRPRHRPASAASRARRCAHASTARRS